MGCRTKNLVGSLFKITVGALNNSRGFRWKALFVLGTKVTNMIIKITVGAFGGKPFLLWVPVTVVSVLIYLLLQEAEVII